MPRISSLNRGIARQIGTRRAEARFAGANARRGRPWSQGNGD
jgi:hypothetical protein